MVKPELGTKRACPSCHSRFYDLNREPIVCPICGVSFLAEALLPSKSDHQPAVVAKPQPAVVEPLDTEDVEIVSLEDVKEEGEDEAADIEDVEIEDQGGDIAQDDTFLEEEEEAEGGVSGLIGGGKGEDEET